MGAVGLVLLGISFVLGNIYKFSVITPEVKISVLDCVVFVLTIVTLWDLKKCWTNLNKNLWVIRPILAFAGIGLLSLLLALRHFSSQEVLVGAMYLGRWLVYSLLPLSLIRLFKVPNLRKILLALGIITVLVSLGQYLLYPDIRSLQVAQWDPHYYRVVGSWLDPGFTGIILVFILIYLTVKPVANKFFHWLTWSGAYLALALTYSRSSYLAFVIGMAWIAWKAKGWKFLLLMIGLLTVTILLLPRAPDGEGVKLERTNSIWARMENWGQAVTIWKDHPLIGVGFNTYRYAQRDYGFLNDKWQVTHAGAGADSSLLLVAATTGILGLGAYLWYWKRLVQMGSQSVVLGASLAALIIHSFFLNSLFYPAVLVWIAVLIAATGQKSP